VTPKYKSKLELKVSEILGNRWTYEEWKIPYIMEREYTPDFTRGKIHIEVKGVFRPGDTLKYRSIQQHMPEGEELVFVLSNPNKKVRKGSKITMGEWCTKNGFRFCSVADLNTKYFGD
jgi:hypothetical protein